MKESYIVFVIMCFRNVRARGPVEQWLGTVEYGMFETVKKFVHLVYCLHIPDYQHITVLT